MKIALMLPLALVAGSGIAAAEAPGPIAAWKIGASEVGPLKVGVALKDVAALTGLTVEKEKSGTNFHRVSSGTDEILTLRVDGADGKVSQMMVRSKAITTQQGIGVGSKATNVAAAYGAKPKDFGGTEGEACFAFPKAPGMVFCFQIDTEQASWAKVQKKNFPVAYVQVPGDK